MRLNLTVRRGHVNDGVRSYVESKFVKLGRRLHAVAVQLEQRAQRLASVRVVLDEKHHGQRGAGLGTGW